MTIETRPRTYSQNRPKAKLALDKLNLAVILYNIDMITAEIATCDAPGRRLDTYTTKERRALAGRVPNGTGPAA
jgi:hypothetical protein